MHHVDHLPRMITDCYRHMRNFANNNRGRKIGYWCWESNLRRSRGRKMGKSVWNQSWTYVTSFPHFHPNFLNLPFFNSVARRKLFLCSQSNEGWKNLLPHPHVILKVTWLTVPTDNITLSCQWCRISSLLNTPISRKTLRLIDWEVQNSADTPIKGHKI